jgi:hypothetical protein
LPIISAPTLSKSRPFEQEINSDRRKSPFNHSLARCPATLHSTPQAWV